MINAKCQRVGLEVMVSNLLRCESHDIYHQATDESNVPSSALTVTRLNIFVIVY